MPSIVEVLHHSCESNWNEENGGQFFCTVSFRWACVTMTSECADLPAVLHSHRKEACHDTIVSGAGRRAAAPRDAAGCPVAAEPDDPTRAHPQDAGGTGRHTHTQLTVRPCRQTVGPHPPCPQTASGGNRRAPRADF